MNKKDSIFTIFAFIFVFINHVFLPVGLSYTLLASPFLYLWLIYKKKKFIFLKFILPLIPYILIQYGLGIEDKFFYIKSLIYYFVTFVMFYAACVKLNDPNLDLERIFNKITIVQTILLFISFFFFFAPPEIREVFWRVDTVSEGIDNYPRLRMFTYEPAHLATLITPIWFFYFFKFTNSFKWESLVYFLMISLSMIFAFSTGVISAIILSIGIYYISNITKILRSKKLFYSLILISAFGIILLISNADALITRIAIFIAGEDDSGNARTVDAFFIGYGVASLKSLWFGAGPGQVKVVGENLMRSVWGYLGAETRDIVLYIPNFIAEVLATFGITGVIAALIFQITIFFKFKVYKNPYKMCMFTFSFIKQFTSGSITNSAMWLIWIFVFTNVFPEFEDKSKERIKSNKAVKIDNNKNIGINGAMDSI